LGERGGRREARGEKASDCGFLQHQSLHLEGFTGRQRTSYGKGSELLMIYTKRREGRLIQGFQLGAYLIMSIGLRD
jgi:hypothetical protein